MVNKNYNVILANAGLHYVKPLFFAKGDETKMDPVGTSYLGTPVFSNLVIEPGRYKKGDQIISYEGITIDIVLFDVSQNRNIQRTAIKGMDGYVVEFISDESYSVTVRGILASKENYNYPVQPVQTLIDICKAKAAIKVASWYLQAFSIHDLIIEGSGFAQKEGTLNSQYFELTCRSYDPVNGRPF
jgi:hypothetical protein